MKDYSSYICASYALTALAFIWMGLDTAIRARLAGETRAKKKKSG